MKETGRFSLSGEILLLEPSTTELYEVQNGSAPTPRQLIPDENHVWIVRLDSRGKSRLFVAGRCARYQIDPVCFLTPAVWYSMHPRPKPRQLPTAGSATRRNIN